MEETKSSPPTTVAAAADGKSNDMSAIARLKKGFLSFAVSVQEGFSHLKAVIVGQAKRIRARNEREATEADLQTAKMQVEATDAAEDTKRRLDISS